MACRVHLRYPGHAHEEERLPALPHGPPQHHLPAPAGRPLPGTQLQEGSAGRSCSLLGSLHRLHSQDAGATAICRLL